MASLARDKHHTKCTFAGFHVKTLGDMNLIMRESEPIGNPGALSEKPLKEIWQQLLDLHKQGLSLSFFFSVKGNIVGKL